MFRIILLISAACISTGCATVNRGTDDHFRIDTVPQGAKITTSIETSKSKRKRRKNKNITPEYKGCDPTPCAIQLPRRSEFTFTVEHAGYEPFEMYITSSKNRGSITANTAASVATTSAAAAATISASAAVAAATIKAFTAGAISPSVSSLITPAVAASAVPPVLAATGASLLVDAGTGANHNLFPNPVVLELTPEGQPVQKDPAAVLFNEREAAKDKYNQNCRSGREAKKINDCPALKLDLVDKKEALKTLLSPPKISDDSP